MCAGYCTLQGTNTDPDTGKTVHMHPLGYAAPATCGLRVSGAAGCTEQAFCGDPNIRVEEDLHRIRAAKVESGAWAASNAGCHGKSLLVERLKYLKYTDVMVVPVCHAFLLGLLKDFWALLLDPPKGTGKDAWFRLPAKHRKVMRARSQGIKLTLDHGRPYACIVTARGFWVMENWWTWAEVVSVWVLQHIQEVRPCVFATTTGKEWAHHPTARAACMPWHG
jgi:hypothetical protein